MANYMPNIHLFQSLAHQNLQWSQALAELIDNSFDAEATRVAIEFDKKKLIVTDDGRGASDILAMIKLGAHVGDNRGLGIYGVGLKDAWWHCGGAIEIDTVHNGQRSRLCLSLKDLKDNWDGPDPIVERTKDPPGTVVKLSLSSKRKSPPDRTWDKIAWIFTPALSEGKQIAYGKGKKRQTLKRIELPPFVEQVTETFEVEGKEASIQIGIIQDGCRIIDGPFWVQYRHRHIQHTSLGAENYSTLRIGGVIKLGAGWTLSKNKNDLTFHKEQLADAIFQRIQWLLKKAENLSQDIEASELKLEIETLLDEALGEYKKEMRNPKENQTGIVLPAFTGRRRRKSTKEQEGCGSIESPASKKKKKGFFRLSWTYLGEGDHRIGEYDATANQVRLNLDNPWISAMKKDMNVAAIFAAAVALIVHEAGRDQGQIMLFETQDFPYNFGKFISSMKGAVNAQSQTA